MQSEAFELMKLENVIIFRLKRSIQFSEIYETPNKLCDSCFLPPSL